MAEEGVAEAGDGPITAESPRISISSARKSSVRKGSSRSGLRRVDSLLVEAGRVKSMGAVHHGTEDLPWSVTLTLAYQTIGVVYGDLGTSPLYVFASTFPDHTPSENDILGALSFIIYTFTLIPLIKYVFIVLRANDHGNGGTFALYSLIARYAKISVSPNQVPEDQEVSSYKLAAPTKTMRRSQYLKEALNKKNWLRNVVVTIAILGTCMVIGDGVLTPSISVLSAIQGIKVNKPSLNQNVVVLVTCVILFALFSIQRFGTDRVGYCFSPIVVIWFISIALIGIYNIIMKDSTVFRAFNPYHMYEYISRNKKQGWISFGGIVLCVTGTEAMFADLGHFSVKAIQIAFTALVYPCLLIAYIGQAAYLLKHPEAVGETFYNSIPDKVYWPMFVVATGAAIIASQAMISATFSIVDQAMTLGCFPRVKVVHTSKKYAGQIYIPELNWLMMVLCIIIAAGFRDTTQIGNAYGVAVVSVFFVTTNFVTLIAIMIWQVPLWIALPCYFFMGSVELTYFSSILYKVPKGGWVPLIFVACFFSVMYTWHYGRVKKYEYEVKNKVSLDWVLGLGSNLGITRVPGIGLVYSELAQGVPTIFSHLISNLPAMHQVLVFVCIKNLPVPYVPDEERFLIRRIGPKQFRMFRCAVRFGYRDLSVGNEIDFEEQLIQNLAIFISTEVQAAQEQPMIADLAQLQRMIDAEGDGGAAPASVALDMTRRLSQGSRDDSEDSQSQSGIKAMKLPPNVDSGVEEELKVLVESKDAGVVYLLGHTEVRSRRSSSRFRKFLIDDYYHALKRNCRASTVSLAIPHERLLQVGMVHYI
ncbi:KUP system potassium uptake protein [Marchantia polymorpha subsp. ruderalis]|uniref:Potassium transporter n=2 Tax=Marchantia polymorpha TaxID=3197 RepID=A0AAF6BWY8_MARPO|nr:hypothetical protein MARPO_0076s0088 [Marchantia polymorpha]BBN16522.1 hypothetical protein Mp_7g07060 [Marchantia polymorpha subsp. ruderalis]|eukprot:PTQ34856.1 hypothetical protein MARPO_0076s0088 [Marchantia polymorpha]